MGDAPHKEVILDLDFGLFQELPLFRISLMNGGFYLLRGCVVARDPENSENQNRGIYRMQIKDRGRIGIQISAQHDLAAYPRKAEKMNVPLRAAVSISNDPITSFVASSPLRYEEDKYAMMGAIRGEPVQVVASEG